MHIQCGTTVMTESEVPMIAQCLSTENPKTKMAGFEKEFQVCYWLFIIINNNIGGDIIKIQLT